MTTKYRRTLPVLAPQPMQNAQPGDYSPGVPYQWICFLLDHMLTRDVNGESVAYPGLDAFCRVTPQTPTNWNRAQLHIFSSILSNLPSNPWRAWREKNLFKLHFPSSLDNALFHGCCRDGVHACSCVCRHACVKLGWVCRHFTRRSKKNYCCWIWTNLWQWQKNDLQCFSWFELHYISPAEAKSIPEAHDRLVAGGG